MIDDPRVWPRPAAAPPDAARLHALARASLEAATGLAAAAHDDTIDHTLAAMLDGDAGTALAGVLDTAPAGDIYRHLWRRLVGVARAAAPSGTELRLTAFALPVIVVAGSEDAATGQASLAAVLADAAAIAAVLREHRALSGNATITLANVLTASDALDIPRLPAWRRMQAWPAQGAGCGGSGVGEFTPVPIVVTPGHETVHLRFLPGIALAAPAVDLLGDVTVGAWGVPLARALSRELAQPGVTALAIPRAPQRPLEALAAGRSLQREVAAQLFATNAIRRMRSTVGEPQAVVSAHRCAEAPGGGELRVSLSSPFLPREAEGLRTPLWPLDRVNDVATMLVGLLRECRVDDVRVLPGIHPDRDPGTGQRLLFKPGVLPEARALQ